MTLEHAGLTEADLELESRGLSVDQQPEVPIGCQHDKQKLVVVALNMSS